MTEIKQKSDKLKSVRIDSIDELIRLGGDMKRIALDKPCDDEHHYSKDQDDLEKTTKANESEAFYYSQHVTLFRMFFISLTLTYDKYESQPFWTLSVGQQVPNPSDPAGGVLIRPSDEICSVLGTCILGEGFGEGKNPSETLPELRFFHKEAE
jgi:hypothetical protein